VNERPRSAVRRFLPAALFLLLTPAAFALDRLSAADPAGTERLYSRSVYPALARAVSALTRPLPFSLAELAVLAGVPLLAALLIWRLFHLRYGGLRRLAALLRRLLCAASALFFAFTVLWGLNYNREPLARSLGYTGAGPDKALLVSMLRGEAAKIDTLCPRLCWSGGVSVYPGGFRKMAVQVNAGYRVLAARDSLIPGIASRPKSLLLSPAMSYSSIEGIFIPFTYEPCLDAEYPAWALPFTMAHETAHLQGFAREDEANFLAYLADCANPDPYFQYSARLTAYIYLSNALYQTDAAAWENLHTGLDARAAADVSAYFSFGQRHEGKLQTISEKVNDSYLKSQGQSGVVSYDAFVTLLAQKARSGR
jgi:hypothetical protein